MDWAPFAGAFWLLALIAAVSTLAGLSQLAFMIAIVQRAIRDPLTGAYSRRCGEEALKHLFSVAERAASPLAVAFLDLDHFKSINDRYGHEIGDRTLAGVAASIMSDLRHGDMLCRWGGEEFIIVMPNTLLSHCFLAIDRIRQKGLGTRPDGQSLLTASIGIAERQADCAADWKTLLEIADRRMYQAKGTGRNCAVTGADIAQ